MQAGAKQRGVKQLHFFLFPFFDSVLVKKYKMSAAAEVTLGENVASQDMLAPTHWEV